MSTTTLIIFVAVLVATVIVNDLTLAITMKKKIEELKIERANLNFSLIQNFKMYFDGVRKKEQQDAEFIAEITKQNDVLREQYEALDEAYEHMNSRYMEICEHYSNLLKCWAGVEERYSDCYEQLKYQNERFDKIEKQLSGIGPFVAGIDLSENAPGRRPNDSNIDISELKHKECVFEKEGICGHPEFISPMVGQECPFLNPETCRYSRLL